MSSSATAGSSYNTWAGGMWSTNNDLMLGLMLGQRRRRWHNTKPAFDQPLMRAGLAKNSDQIAGLMLGQRRR